MVTARNKPPVVLTSLSPPQRGFSLVELLVAMFVIILITSMVSLNVNSGSSDVQLETAVHGLADSAAYALDEAQFLGQDYGLLVEQKFDPGATRFSYSWHARYIDGWKIPESGKEVFAAREMPEGIALELEIENSPFQEVDLDEDEELLQPQFVFYASGETTIGAINVRRAEDSELLWRIEWDLLGRFQVLRRGIPEDEDF